MANFLDTYNRYKKIDVDELFNRSVLENKAEILDANTDQLAHGKYASGGFMPDYATEEYGAFKKSIGSIAPLGIPDLHLEGDFTELFQMEVGFGNNFAIFSTDDKASKLEKQYGFDIYGIPEGNTDIRTSILESLRNNLRHGLLQ